MLFCSSKVFVHIYMYTWYVNAKSRCCMFGDFFLYLFFFPIKGTDPLLVARITQFKNDCVTHVQEIKIKKLKLEVCV